MSVVLAHQSRGERAQRAAPGLVGQVTSRTLPTLSIACAARELNKRRRVRRMRRVVIGSADASREVVSRGGIRCRPIFVTLTYRADQQFTTRDVSRYIELTRKWLQRRGVRAMYQWVIELTKKGKPHYHVLWWVPLSVRLPKPDESGSWSKGSSNIQRAFSPVGYLVKYATKADDGNFPKGVRLFGVGAAGVDEVALARHRFGLPTWLHERTSEDTRCTRVTRVGWVEKNSGEIHVSPFSIEFTKDAWGLVVVVVTTKG